MVSVIIKQNTAQEVAQKRAAQKRVAQKTLQNEVHISGVGLHSGREVRLRICPAPADSGIVFARVDLPAGTNSGPCDVHAHATNVVATAMSTTLASSDALVGTVEHLMAAFAGFHIDNARVEVDGSELPIMDGSAAPFLTLFKQAGACEQDQPRRFIRILKQVRYTEGDTSAQLEPYDGFRVAYTLIYDHPVFRSHATQAVVDFADSTFDTEVSEARTFGFLDDFERLQKMNLARGGSLENAVVVDHAGIVNSGGLRSDDEFVKHKILDAVGDLYLLGGPIIGAFTGHKSGHAANNALLRMLPEDPDAYELVSFDDAADITEAARSVG